ncbi:MAG: hypothetical protein HFJ53_03480 [Clostridia bacterium]|nr:hypothetical protein [Clostridia bacterium]
MKIEEKQIKKVCSFYVNEWHLTTMLLPNLKNNIQENICTIALLEKGIQENIKTLMEKMNFQKEFKEKILKTRWTSNQICSSENIKEYIQQQKTENNNVQIIINGDIKYIDTVNKNIERLVEKQQIKIEKITIINCYEITQFSDIKEILNKHDMVLNTSGIKEIKEVFDGYEKAI